MRLWPKRNRTDDSAQDAARELTDLKKRQEKVASAMVQIRIENGFIRQVRESMGPLP